MSTDLIRAFRALQTTDSRQQALQALFAELSPHEWRAARDLAATRVFHHDIIGSLPLEIVAQIFSYLDDDITLPFRLQLVSKRWQTVLQSPVILRPTMHPLEGKPTHCENYDDFLCKAQNIHRFRCGIPRNVRILDEGKNQVFVYNHESPGRRPVLMEDVLVGLDKSERAIVSWNLRDGGSWHAHSPAREKIYKFVALKEFVVFVTMSGTSYYHSRNGSRMRSIKLPTQQMTIMAGHGNTIAYGAILPSKLHLYFAGVGLHNKSSSVDIGRDQPPFNYWMNGCASPSVLLHLNTETNTMVFFTSNACGSSACEACHSARNFPGGSSVYFGIFTLDGHLLEHGAFQMYYERRHITLQSLEPTNRKGQYALVVETFRSISQRTTLVFDEKRRNFAHVPPEYAPALIDWEGHRIPEVSWFNDTCYIWQFQRNVFRPEGSDPGEHVLLSLVRSGFTPFPREINFLDETKPVIVDRTGREARNVNFLVNDQFAVLWTNVSQVKEGEENGRRQNQAGQNQGGQTEGGHTEGGQTEEGGRVQEGNTVTNTGPQWHEYVRLRVLHF
ncbi:hypothetical protein DM02DRAFT_723501 [Periconia macrospinosa]|uniref:F-box domain-containing protein n=1 Tax=Periconia macrospinosa TaxID=97972 RepID=A0A2V1E9K6_9PLEO|nr:hypothetical protein DM02DRAFT_723501 [Periconia macrospinosa]